MKLNYKWGELKQHTEDENYFWMGLHTPFGVFTIATNLYSDKGKYGIHYGGSVRPRVTVNTIEEGKEWVNAHLIEQSKLVLEAIDENELR